LRRLSSCWTARQGRRYQEIAVGVEAGLFMRRRCHVCSAMPVSELLPEHGRTHVDRGRGRASAQRRRGVQSITCLDSAANHGRQTRNLRPRTIF
jgi:hypothetical protein